RCARGVERGLERNVFEEQPDGRWIDLTVVQPRWPVAHKGRSLSRADKEFSSYASEGQLAAQPHHVGNGKANVGPAELNRVVAGIIPHLSAGDFQAWECQVQSGHHANKTSGLK